MPEAEPIELLTSAQTARILRCVPENVRRLAKAGRLPIAATVGNGQRLFDRRIVERIAAERAARRSHGDEAA